jgi:hypothetical protein
MLIKNSVEQNIDNVRDDEDDQKGQNASVKGN